MRKIGYIGGLVSIAAALAFVAAWLVRSGKADASTAVEVVYLCRETKQLVTAPPQPTPAVNPATGRATLYRALYCRQCGRWRAVAPSQVAGGNPMSNVCPRHRQPMSPDGPLDGKRSGR